MKSICNIKWLSALIVVPLLVSACGEVREVDKKTEIVSTNAQMNSEDLALAGEQLVGPYTFMLADKVFDQALQKDPKNQRALFYKAFLKPFMAYKGIVNRIHPLVEEFGDAKKFEKELNRIPNSSFKEFITQEGQPKISTTADAQAFLTDIRNGFDEFRVFLKKNSSMDLNINLNPYLFEQAIRSKMYNSCRISPKYTDAEAMTGNQLSDEDIQYIDSNQDYYDYECDPSMMAKVGINMADVKFLQQYAAGMVLFLTPYTSYKFDGLKALIKADIAKQETDSPNFTAKEVQDQLESNPEFGKLRKDESMTLVAKLGSDLAAAWKWAIENQSALCPSVGNQWEVRRPHMLLENGVCIDNTAESKKDLGYFNAILSGATRQVIEKANGQEVETTVNSMALFKSPVQNLRDIAPSSYNACDKAAALRDPFFGGVFPEGNANEILVDDNCN